ncbi:hypothetical protein B0E49_18510 [Polaromonas sp. C04]|nr:hypothetical protein B0E49_18510 [Polaromonas sp. C04]
MDALRQAPVMEPQALPAHALFPQIKSICGFRGFFPRITACGLAAHFGACFGGDLGMRKMIPQK